MIELLDSTQLVLLPALIMITWTDSKLPICVLRGMGIPKGMMAIMVCTAMYELAQTLSGGFLVKTLLS